MSTSIHEADPGPSDETRIYEVIESRPVPSEDHVGQVVAAGRSAAGIHLLLTDQAVEVLAHILFHHEDAVAHEQITRVDRYDPSMWSHVAIDLLAARALNVTASTGGSDVVYARLVAGRRGEPA